MGAARLFSWTGMAPMSPPSSSSPPAMRARKARCSSVSSGCAAALPEPLLSITPSPADVVPFGRSRDMMRSPPVWSDVSTTSRVMISSPERAARALSGRKTDRWAVDLDDSRQSLLASGAMTSGAGSARFSRALIGRGKGEAAGQRSRPASCLGELAWSSRLTR